MRLYKTGDPCPLCGQPILTTDPERLLLISLVAASAGAAGDRLALEVPEITMSEWISVKDRLPPPGERVLCFAKAIGKVTSVHCDAMTVDWFGANGGWIPIDEGYVFTHWMPLPQPPEVEE